MFENQETREKAILAGVHTGSLDILSDTNEETIAELQALADTAGVETVGTVIQNRSAPDNATYFGEGKLQEVKCLADELGADVIIFDDELSPVQVRNVSRELDLKVIDRTMLILDIFAARAMTSEGKIQVELAQLRYLLPRLMGMGQALSRQGAGIGTRGPGETKLESDRRHIRRRIDALSDELKDIQRHRDLLRSRRKKDSQSVIAIVGYTNAGKSLMLNRMTGAEALTQNKLFATLDPTVRGLTLSDNREVLLVDTVGFIRKLPHHLIKAFKSTLEEVKYADMLIHVIDASNPEHMQHITVVEDILSELGAKDKPTIAVFNKIDILGLDDIVMGSVEGVAATLSVSVKEGWYLDKLMQKIEELTPGRKQRVTLLLPYTQTKLTAMLHNDQVVEKEEYVEDGVLLTALVDEQCYEKVRSFVRS